MKNKGSNQNRRNNIQIFGDILNAIELESSNNKIRTTRIQTIGNISSVKLKQILSELEKKGLVTSNPIKIEEKGRRYINDYEKIKFLIDDIDAKYLENQNSDMLVNINVNSSNYKEKYLILHEHEQQMITQYRFVNMKNHYMKELKQIELVSGEIRKLLRDDKSISQKNKNLVKMNILIIDDNKTITTMLTTLYGIHGHRTTTINYGEEGLEKIMTSKYDLVIVDLAMPIMNGLDIIHKLEENNLIKENNIVVLSAMDVDKEIIQKIQDKNIQFLKKPLNGDELMKLIE